eukprot:2930752-Karenia_brevis.AAC.1
MSRKPFIHVGTNGGSTLSDLTPLVGIEHHLPGMIVQNFSPSVIENIVSLGHLRRHMKDADKGSG